MPHFRKKPVVITAEQYLEGQSSPRGICVMDELRGDCPGARPHVHTVEGPLAVSDKDWIVTGVQGEQYPVKPDIFEQTYDPVE